jgi:pimeloyl-ACP methyl ester carboxylesterase
MRTVRATAAVFVALTISGQAAAQSIDRTVQVNGHKLHLQVIEAQQTLPNGPTLLFESGLGDPGDIWDRVIARLPHDRPIITYDRPGLGSSEDDKQAPTLRYVASILHDALQQVHARPPYLMVGHSFGAARLRMFAAMYPSEVAGIVFVDPVDYTSIRDDGLRDVWARMGLGAKERDESEERSAEQMKAAPPVVYREFQVALDAAQSDYREFKSLPPLPDLPLVILIANQRPPAGMTAPYNLDTWFRLTMEARIASLTRLSATLPRSEVVVTSNPDHGLHRSDPGLVVWTIERVRGRVN